MKRKSIFRKYYSRLEDIYRTIRFNFHFSLFLETLYAESKKNSSLYQSIQALYSKYREWCTYYHLVPRSIGTFYWYIKQTIEKDIIPLDIINDGKRTFIRVNISLLNDKEIYRKNIDLAYQKIKILEKK